MELHEGLVELHEGWVELHEGIYWGAALGMGGAA